MYKKYLTKEQAIQKIKHYCGYQERCHQDVINKLFQLGVRNNWHSEIIATVIEEGYLNEERFAKSFASGHFKLKNWGRIKIFHELKSRQIGDYCIKKALKEIDPEEYVSTIKKLSENKYLQVRDKQKTFEYLLSKGFETELISKNLTLPAIPTHEEKGSRKGKAT